MFVAYANVNPNTWVVLCQSECPAECNIEMKHYSSVTGNECVMMYEDEYGQATLVMENEL